MSDTITPQTPREDKDLPSTGKTEALANVHVLPDQRDGLDTQLGDTSELADALRVIEIPENKWIRRYRSVPFQMVILGVLSFSGPSMSDAISGLGGGGQATPYTANLASSVQYAMSAVTAMFGGPIIGLIGIPWACRVGAVGFPLSGSGFYVLSKYKIQWYVVFAKAIYGFTSAFLYVAESSAMISYPEEHRRGMYITIWLLARNIGPMISGAISLGLNVKGSGKGAIATNTYLIFLGLECLGVPAAILLSQSRKVIRSDGYGVPILPRRSWTYNMKRVWEHHKQKRTLLLIPAYIFSFYGDGVWFTYLGTHFSVRSRAFSALFSPACLLVVNPLFGMVLDHRKWGPRARGRLAYGIFMVGSIVQVLWGIGMTKRLNDREAAGGSVLDYKDTPALFWAAYIPFWVYNLWCFMAQSLLYWTLGNFGSDVATNARTGGVFRAWQTVGQAISYAVDSKAHSPWINMSILLVICVVTTPCLYTVIEQLPVETKAIQVVDASGQVIENPNKDQGCNNTEERDRNA